MTSTQLRPHIVVERRQSHYNDSNHNEKLTEPVASPRVITLNNTASSLVAKSKSLAATSSQDSARIDESNENEKETKRNEFPKSILKTSDQQNRHGKSNEQEMESTSKKNHTHHSGIFHSLFTRKHKNGGEEKTTLVQTAKDEDKKSSKTTAAMKVKELIHLPKAKKEEETQEDEEFKKECEIELKRRFKNRGFGVHAREEHDKSRLSKIQATKHDQKSDDVTSSNPVQESRNFDQETGVITSKKGYLGIRNGGTNIHTTLKGPPISDKIKSAKANFRLELKKTPAFHKQLVSKQNDTIGLPNFTLGDASKAKDTTQNLKPSCVSTLPKSATSLSDKPASPKVSRNTVAQDNTTWVIAPDVNYSTNKLISPVSKTTQPLVRNEDSVSPRLKSPYSLSPDAKRDEKEDEKDRFGIAKSPSDGSRLSRNNSSISGEKSMTSPVSNPDEKSGSNVLKPGRVDKGEKLRSVVFYQNRFLVIDTPKAKATSDSHDCNNQGMAKMRSGSRGDKLSSETREGKGDNRGENKGHNYVEKSANTPDGNKTAAFSSNRIKVKSAHDTDMSERHVDKKMRHEDITNNTKSKSASYTSGTSRDNFHPSGNDNIRIKDLTETKCPSKASEYHNETGARKFRARPMTKGNNQTTNIHGWFEDCEKGDYKEKHKEANKGSYLPYARARTTDTKACMNVAVSNKVISPEGTSVEVSETDLTPIKSSPPPRASSNEENKIRRISAGARTHPALKTGEIKRITDEGKNMHDGLKDETRRDYQNYGFPRKKGEDDGWVYDKKEVIPGQRNRDRNQIRTGCVVSNKTRNTDIWDDSERTADKLGDISDNRSYNASGDLDRMSWHPRDTDANKQSHILGNRNLEVHNNMEKERIPKGQQRDITLPGYGFTREENKKGGKPLEDEIKRLQFSTRQTEEHRNRCNLKENDKFMDEDYFDSRRPTHSNTNESEDQYLSDHHSSHTYSKGNRDISVYNHEHSFPLHSNSIHDTHYNIRSSKNNNDTTPNAHSPRRLKEVNDEKDRLSNTNKHHRSSFPAKQNEIFDALDDQTKPEQHLGPSSSLHTRCDRKRGNKDGNNITATSSALNSFHIELQPSTQRSRNHRQSPSRRATLSRDEPSSSVVLSTGRARADNAEGEFREYPVPELPPTTPSPPLSSTLKPTSPCSPRKTNSDRQKGTGSDQIKHNLSRVHETSQPPPIVYLCNEKHINPHSKDLEVINRKTSLNNTTSRVHKSYHSPLPSHSPSTTYSLLGAAPGGSTSSSQSRRAATTTTSACSNPEHVVPDVSGRKECNSCLYDGDRRKGRRVETKYTVPVSPASLTTRELEGASPGVDNESRREEGSASRKPTFSGGKHEPVVIRRRLVSDFNNLTARNNYFIDTEDSCVSSGAHQNLDSPLSNSGLNGNNYRKYTVEDKSENSDRRIPNAKQDHHKSSRERKLVVKDCTCDVKEKIVSRKKCVRCSAGVSGISSARVCINSTDTDRIAPSNVLDSLSNLGTEVTASHKVRTGAVDRYANSCLDSGNSNSNNRRQASSTNSSKPEEKCAISGNVSKISQRSDTRTTPSISAYDTQERYVRSSVRKTERKSDKKAHVSDVNSDICLDYSYSRLHEENSTKPECSYTPDHGTVDSLVVVKDNGSVNKGSSRVRALTFSDKADHCDDSDINTVTHPRKKVGRYFNQKDEALERKPYRNSIREPRYEALEEKTKSDHKEQTRTKKDKNDSSLVSFVNYGCTDDSVDVKSKTGHEENWECRQKHTSIYPELEKNEDHDVNTEKGTLISSSDHKESLSSQNHHQRLQNPRGRESRSNRTVGHVSFSSITNQYSPDHWKSPPTFSHSANHRTEDKASKPSGSVSFGNCYDNSVTPPLSPILTNNRLGAYKKTDTPESTPLLTQTNNTMDGRGIEIIVSDENDARVSTVHSGKRAVLRRIWMILLDNRVAGRPDCERALRPHPEEYRVLKRVLNIIFITIGVALLVSVFVVIIYTYVVDETEERDGDNYGAYNKKIKPSLFGETTTSSNSTLLSTTEASLPAS